MLYLKKSSNSITDCVYILLYNVKCNNIDVILYRTTKLYTYNAENFSYVKSYFIASKSNLFFYVTKLP